ncbi:MAG: amidohydrolase [Maribacter dokdonensis]
MEDKKDSLKIALVQSLLHWENPAANRQMFSDKFEQITEQVDLIVLPEMFSTGFTMSPSNIRKEEGSITVRWMQEMASIKNCAIVGSIVFEEDGSYYNRLFFVKPEGDFKIYDKRHTFTLAGENEKYSAGTERLIVEYKGFSICPLICYDLRFPVWSRNTQNFDMLLYTANWPGKRIAAWDALLKARAIENMVYCIGVNRIGTDSLGHQYPGHSSIYDPLGELQAFTKEEEIKIVKVEKSKVDKIKNKLRFLDDRDEFSLLN